MPIRALLLFKLKPTFHFIKKPDIFFVRLFLSVPIFKIGSMLLKTLQQVTEVSGRSHQWNGGHFSIIIIFVDYTIVNYREEIYKMINHTYIYLTVPNYYYVFDLCLKKKKPKFQS